MYKSLKDILKYVVAKAPVVVAASTPCAGFKGNDFGAVTHLVMAGANTGTALAAGHKIDIVMQHSDVDVDGSYANCVDADIYNAEVGASGIVKSIDATEDANQIYPCHYRGVKPYSRVRLVVTGSPSVTMAVATLGGYPELNPPL